MSSIDVNPARSRTAATSLTSTLRDDENAALSARVIVPLLIVPTVLAEPVAKSIAADPEESYTPIPSPILKFRAAVAAFVTKVEVVPSDASA